MTAQRRHQSPPPTDIVEEDVVAEQRPQRERLIAAGVCVWLVIFFAIFFSFTLPNFQPITRLDVWRLVPWDLLDTIAPTEPQPREVSSWSNLPQRFTPAFVAVLILSAAWALGHLVLRLLRPQLDGPAGEETFFAFAIGLSGWSLITLVLGCCGWLSRGLFGGLIATAIIAEVALRLMRRAPKSSEPESDTAESVWNYNIWLIMLVPFVLCMILGALLPSTDFDVLEYHWEGPKEYYLAGQIQFLPHNVYTSFPFGTEMLTLAAMVLMGDWYWGAVAGKGVLMCFGLVTALGIYSAGRRWFSMRAGIYAAAIFLSAPWIYRISTIAYAEGGLSFYLFAALYATKIGIDRAKTMPDARQLPGTFLLAGLLAGSAMSCKYPGLLSVVIPLGIASIAAGFLQSNERSAQVRSALRYAAAFALGTIITIGPWLLKNSLETGNPVYPLAYSIFGGADWDAQLNAKWKAGHSPKTHSLLDLAEKFKDVTVKSDWLSPFLFGIAPLAFLLKSRRRLVIWLWVYVCYLFLTWWIFTHRIDRFWVPMIPVVALLAGAGATWSSRLSWRTAWIGLFALVSLYHLTMIVTPFSLCGYNAFLIDYDRARQHTEGYYSPGMPRLNRELPPQSKVLCVGNAVVFAAEFPVVYNTVFDYSIFEQWFADPQPGLPPGEWPLRSADEIRQKLREEGITHVYVNWAEILRYRDRGSYGYTDFVMPARFAELQRIGILGPEWTINDQSGYGSWEQLSETNRAELRAWQPSLLRSLTIPPNNQPTQMFVRYQIFPVTKE